MSRIAAPRRALVLLAASIGLVALTAALGPSAAVPPLPGPRLGPLPPYASAAHPPAALVTALLAAAVAAGALGLLGAMRALRAGWAPAPRRLLAAGLLATAGLALLPPVGSADPKSYAAYGRIAATGGDPYTTTPAQRAAAGDPVGAAVEPPWQRAPSVYGPLATAEQALAARVAGPSPRAAVGLLGVVNATAFALAGLLLVGLAADPAGRRRAALLWALNPLLLQQVVAGAHLDALVAAAVVAALAVRPALLAGAAAGVAAAVKPPGAVVALGLAWAYRRAPAALAGVVAGLLAVLVPAYVAAGPHVLDQTRRASRYVSFATPWRPVTDALDHLVGQPAARAVVGLAALVITAVLALLLTRALPPGPPAARAAAAVALGYLLAAPYALPWYDALGWALLVPLAASAYDEVLLAHTAALSLAYLPGRDVPLPGWLDVLTAVTRSAVGPLLLLVVVVAVVALARPRAAWRG